MPDSWEKIEQDIRGNCECARGKPCNPPHNGPHCIYQAELDEWADRLRALRERDEKRWEIVGQCIEYADVAENTFKSWERSRREYEASDNMRYLGNRLREAREGK